MDKKQPDYLLRFWLLALSITLVLGALYFLPERIGSWELNKVDLLGDLRRSAADSTTETEVDALALSQAAKKDDQVTQKREAIHLKLIQEQQAEQQASPRAPLGSIDTDAALPADSTLQAHNNFVDMSPHHDALIHFYDALHRRSSLGRPVRIAVLGDSFIEGDIFTGSLRKALQERYGGSGVGWLPMSSETAGFRKTVRHEFKGWRERNQLHAKGRFPITGHYYTAAPGDWARYTLSRPCELATIYYKATSPVTLSLKVNGGEPQELILPATEGEAMRSYTLAEGQVRSIYLSVGAEASALTCYGISLDGKSGISLDNFSLRGHSGTGLRSVASDLNAAFCAARPYDLIVLQYGLNIISPKQLDYTGYAKQMAGAIQHLRQQTGRADYLLLGVSDRGTKQDGVVVTMPAVRSLEQAQIRLAAAQGLAFWSTRSAVLQIGGIGQLAAKGWASKDFTHLSHRGGAELARIFLEAFTLEAKYYDAIR